MADEENDSTKHPIIKLREALEECLASAESSKQAYAEDARRLATEFGSKDDFESQFFAGIGEGQRRMAEALDAATSEEFRNAARELVEAIISGVTHGVTHETLKAWTDLERETRSRRWLRSSGDFFSSELSHRNQGTTMDPRIQEGAASFLRDELVGIDARASSLSTDQIVALAKNSSITSSVGFAAKLASICGAFEKKPIDVDPTQELERHKRARRIFEGAAQRGLVSIWHTLPGAASKRAPKKGKRDSSAKKPEKSAGPMAKRSSKQSRRLQRGAVGRGRSAGGGG